MCAASVGAAFMYVSPDKFESVKEWAEPRKIGRMIYDDKAFYESLLKQHKAGKDLSAKQLAALQKLAGKYSLL